MSMRKALDIVWFMESNIKCEPNAIVAYNLLEDIQNDLNDIASFLHNKSAQTQYNIIPRLRRASSGLSVVQEWLISFVAKGEH